MCHRLFDPGFQRDFQGRLIPNGVMNWPLSGSLRLRGLAARPRLLIAFGRAPPSVLRRRIIRARRQLSDCSAGSMTSSNLNPSRTRATSPDLNVREVSRKANYDESSSIA